MAALSQPTHFSRKCNFLVSKGYPVITISFFCFSNYMSSEYCWIC